MMPVHVRIPVPSAPGRTARDPELRKSFEEQLRAKQAAIKQQQELWGRLARFVHANGGWLTSAPGERPLRVEMPVHSELADRLFDLGYDLHPADGITGERVVGGTILPTVRFQFQVSIPR
jgi:hypothetical protein